MTVDEALACVWREASRSSQAMVAEAIGVSPATITRWKDGHRPLGKGIAKLLSWAEALPPGPPPPDVMIAAIQRTAENLMKLGEIRGQARGVLTMLQAVTAEQQRVVDSLEPWSMAEAQLLAAQPVVEAAMRDVMESAAATALGLTEPSRPAGSPAKPSRRTAGR